MVEYDSHAGMTELADVQDLGSCGEIRVGSTPTTRTIIGHQSPCAVHQDWCLFQFTLQHILFFDLALTSNIFQGTPTVHSEYH